jgi:hypothetical protein
MLCSIGRSSTMAESSASASFSYPTIVSMSMLVMRSEMTSTWPSSEDLVESDGLTLAPWGISLCPVSMPRSSRPSS